MIRNTLRTLMLLLLVAAAAAVYLHHQRALSRYSPELDRILTDVDRQIQVLWRETAGFRSVLEKAWKRLDGFEKLREYLPDLGRAKEPSEPSPGIRKDGPATADAPRQSSPPVPEIIYTWIDKRGVRQFSDTLPEDKQLNVEVIRR